MADVKENSEYLESQILTYMGNKRSLLSHIGEEILRIQNDLNVRKLVCLDLFSGSGIVARYLKQFSSAVYANDLEAYSWVINSCYLTNQSEFDKTLYLSCLSDVMSAVHECPVVDGIISQNYAPINTNAIKAGERVFYTHENAVLIDSIRYYIDKLVPEHYRKYFLARLLTEASVHVNTSGVFKGFYKDKNTGVGKFGGAGENALVRILGSIDMACPILSNFETEYRVYQENANILVRNLDAVDVAYLDPPYNQHPYGSNYFMLNVILNNKLPADISEVSGIPLDWNRSAYNRRADALSSLDDLLSNLHAKYVVISYNNEGFISKSEMEEMLSKYGDLSTRVIEYNAFRGSRNLRNRSLKTNEYLFVLRKDC